MHILHSAGAVVLALALTFTGSQPSAAGFWDLFRRDPEPAPPAQVTPLPPPPPATQALTPLSQTGGAAAQALPPAPDLPTRVDRLEAQIRALTGQIEQLAFQLQEL